MSKIKAGTTTTTAYQVEADTTGALVLQTGATPTTALTLGTDQSATFAGAVNAPNTFSFKNRIINGAMVIDQRNAGASVTPANGAYTLDRWRATLTQSSKYSVQQNAGSVTPPVGFTNYLGSTSLSAYSVVSGDIFCISQNIEGLNLLDFAWGTANAQTITLSFWVRSSLTGTFGGALQNNGSTRSYPFTYTISSANTWEQKTITITGDTSGTWLTTNGIGLSVLFGLGGGSSFSGTAGSWTSSDFRTATGATSVVGTSGATFYITGVQLEKGSTATSFDYRPYGTELALCQRYYEVIGGNSGGFPSLQSYGAAAASYAQSMSFNVAKRAAPTMAVVGTWTVTNSSQPTADAASTTGFRIYAVATLLGRCIFETTNSSNYITASAEL